MKEPAARGLDRARGPTHFCETTVETLEKPHSGVSASDRCGAHIIMSHKKHTQAHTSIRKQLSVKWAEGGRHRHRREPRPRDRESHCIPTPFQSGQIFRGAPRRNPPTPLLTVFLFRWPPPAVVMEPPRAQISIK